MHVLSGLSVCARYGAAEGEARTSGPLGFLSPRKVELRAEPSALLETVHLAFVVTEKEGECGWTGRGLQAKKSNKKQQF
jgi:hypothetical protein